MRVALDYVLARVEAEGLDRMVAHQKSGGGLGKIAQANSVEEIKEILSTLPSQVQGDIVLKVWKATANKGRKGLQEVAYTWTVAGTMDGGAVNGAPGYAGGPSWREFMELRLQLMQKEIEAKHASKEKDGIGFADFAPLLQGLIGRLGSAAPTPSPVTGAEQPAPAASPKAASGRDPELDAILADVVRFYRRNPEQARQMAPSLHAMANGTDGQA